MDDIELIQSPLAQTYSANGHRLEIHIYRITGSPWSLEVVNELGTSTVWDDTFETDQDALDEALATLEAEGIESFITSGSNEASERERESFSSAPQNATDMAAPLTDEELEELDLFLLYQVTSDDSMTLDILDGFLHAIAIGPETLMPSQWLPCVWGETGSILPAIDSPDQINRVMNLIMRHFNSILTGFEQSPPLVLPYWETYEYEGGDFDDVESWAYGFAEGVALNRAAWQPLFDSPQGQQWYSPIDLLSASTFSLAQNELTRTPQQREQLTQQIEASLVNIRAFWMPLREAIYQRELSQRLRGKVGRNEPCPCGSGKKFKKCCGWAGELH